MADRFSLEVMGFIFGGITAVVVAIGAFVVSTHVVRADTKVALDRSAPDDRSAPLVPVALTVQR
jgi:hypothetical protein